MGGLYNMIHGYNPACLWIMPMLGRKEDEWPRFRDCYVEGDKEKGYLICIFTRVGGGNRGCGYGEEELYKDPNYVSTDDWPDDDTYAVYRFKVPEKWKADFDLVIEGRVNEVSLEYQKYLREFFPKINERGDFDKIFGGSSKMKKFDIKDIDGNVLFVVDTDVYPDARPHKCKIKDPANNVVTSYKGVYVIAKRHRNGLILTPYNWLPITHEFYDMFVAQGAKVVEPDAFLINYVDSMEGL